ncbi:membrane protein [hydrothermal vent metagenome]|uniref:Membrane protein n=1 Tax=hydrothermal vent metagenome TaxID=652676 RepID=A0A1W1CWX2_9ZZZZ
MQLNDILEENSIKAISKKTKIAEENLENLLNKNFDALKKIKTLGFISIIEREYHVDLSTFKEEAKAYYGDTQAVQSVTLNQSVLEEKKGKSKIFILFIFILLGVTTWYFLVQFDKKNLSKLIPFINESFIGSKKIDSIDVKDLNVQKVNVAVSVEEENR